MQSCGHATKDRLLRFARNDEDKKARNDSIKIVPAPKNVIARSLRRSNPVAGNGQIAAPFGFAMTSEREHAVICRCLLSE